MAQPLVMSTAGKTSPRILEDLLRYDPRLEERAERNILASLPHRFDPQASTRKPAIPQGSCSHILILKADESVLPNTDTVAWEEGTRLKVATICSRCRYHFDLFVQHKRQGVGQPCGTGKGEPLHHFACRGISHGEYIDPTDLTADPRTPSSSTFDFICQFEQCQMVLKVLSRPPAILPEDYRLLMDGDRLDARHRAVLKEHRDVKPQPIPAMVLATLRVYIGNALNPDWLPRTIPFTHKTFLALFGTDTQTFLHRLGFTPTAEDHPDGLGRWIPPIPTDSEDVWRRPDKRTYLQDVYQELGIVLWDCKPHEREEVASRMEIYPLVTKVNAVSSIESILSCAGYEKKPGARATRSTRSDEEDHPHYASLGAVADFSDNLILFAWKTQSFFDKLDHAYYLDCLRGIAQGRGSEALSVEVALADSRGVYDRKTIDNAFRCLGIDPQKGPTLTGEQILNHYNVRYQDVGERTRMDMREMRKILAHVFDLQCLSDSSDELLDTYEACLRFLEADDSYSDEFIQVAYQTKVKTRDSSEDRKGEADREVTRARHALKIIAERRHSDALMAFVTAEIDDDDVTQAFNFFNIKERDGYIDPEMIDMYALTHQQDNPFNWNEIERHRKSLVRHIARKFPSGRRYSYLQSHSPESDPKDHPVGLRNIGNTCYLASVLQFLYSIRPFRDVILTFPGNVDDNVNGKLINGTMYGSNEVALGRAFVKELKKLFMEMSTSQVRVVEPSRNLAILTLLTGAQYNHPSSPAMRRRSTLSGVAHPVGLGVIDGLAVQGPSLPQSPTLMRRLTIPATQEESDQDTLIGESDKAPRHTDAMDVDLPEASPKSKAGEKGGATLEALLAEEAEQEKPDEQHKAVGMEGDRQTKPENASGSVAKKTTSLVETNDQQKSNAAEGSTTGKESPDETQTDPKTTRTEAAPPKPNRPPPIPPRPNADEERFHEAEAASQQQDVNEVMGFINLKVQWAIKQRSGQGFEKPGDPIQDLFYWKMLNFKPGEMKAYHSQLQTEITAYLHEGPRHIYDVLDGEFGLEPVHDPSHTRVMYTRYAAIDDPSPFFQVSVARAVMNYETNRAEKIEHKLELVDTLYLDRYIASDDQDLLRKREQSWKLRNEIEELKETAKAQESVESLKTLPDALTTLAEYFEAEELSGPTNIAIDTVTDSVKVNDDNAAKRRSTAEQTESPPALKRARSNSTSIPSGAMALSQKLTQTALEFGKDKNGIDEGIKAAENRLEQLFDDETYKQHKYRLFAVFMHRGGAHGGHYWINIRDFSRGLDDANACWRKYNDESVREIADWKKEVFDQEEQHPATPYHIVYVREENIFSHTQPLYRDIPEPEIVTEQPTLDKTAPVYPSPSNSSPEREGGIPKWVKDDGRDTQMLDPPRQSVEKTSRLADRDIPEIRSDIEMKDLSRAGTMDSESSDIIHKYGMTMLNDEYDDEELLQDLVTSDNEHGLSSDDTMDMGDDLASIHSIDRAKPVEAPEFF